MKPRLGNAPRATPVAATGGADARQLGSGRVREVQPPGPSQPRCSPQPSRCRPAHRCRQSRVEAAGRDEDSTALDGLPGTTSAARQVANATRGASAPLVGLGPPASVETQPSGQAFCTDSTVRLPVSNQRGAPPSLRIEATAPAGGARRGPPRSQGTPERPRLIEPINGQPTEPACQSRWSARLRAGASRLTGCPPGLPGRSTAPPARTRRPGVLALWGEVASLGQSIEKLSAPSKPSRRIN